MLPPPYSESPLNRHTGTTTTFGTHPVHISSPAGSAGLEVYSPMEESPVNPSAGNLVPPDEPAVTLSTERRYTAVVHQFIKNNALDTPKPSSVAEESPDNLPNNVSYVSWGKIDPPASTSISMDDSDVEIMRKDLSASTGFSDIPVVCVSPVSHEDALHESKTDCSFKLPLSSTEKLELGPVCRATCNKGRSGSSYVATPEAQSKEGCSKTDASFKLKSAFSTSDNGGTVPPSVIGGDVSWGESYLRPDSLKKNNSSLCPNFSSRSPVATTVSADSQSRVGSSCVRETPLFSNRRQMLTISPGAVDKSELRHRRLQRLSIGLLIFGCALALGAIIALCVYFVN